MEEAGQRLPTSEPANSTRCTLLEADTTTNSSKKRIAHNPLLEMRKKLTVTLYWRSMLRNASSRRKFIRSVMLCLCYFSLVIKFAFVIGICYWYLLLFFAPTAPPPPPLTPVNSVRIINPMIEDTLRMKMKMKALSPSSSSTTSSRKPTVPSVSYASTSDTVPQPANATLTSLLSDPCWSMAQSSGTRNRNRRSTS